MPFNFDEADNDDLRICTYSIRNFRKEVFRCGFYEAEDVLARVKNVDLISLQPKKLIGIREECQKRMIWHDASRRIVSMNMSCRPIQLSKQYDLFVAYVAYYQDLIYLPAIRDWRKRARTSVCWIDELWAKAVPHCKPWLEGLKQFDHVIVGLKGTADALSNAIGRQCHAIPAGVDALRFCPYPNAPARVIDFYSIGRLLPSVHRGLLDLSARANLFYVHDTFNANNSGVPNYRQHREMLANMAKRSRFMLVAPARVNDPNFTGGQTDVGFRFYEASASGAILLGQVPECDAFRTMFNWHDSVIEIREDGSDLEAAVIPLLADPSRLMEISRRNVLGSLTRHDWVYRWKDVFKIAGMECPQGLLSREAKLLRLAQSIQEGTMSAFFRGADKGVFPSGRTMAGVYPSLSSF